MPGLIAEQTVQLEKREIKIRGFFLEWVQIGLVPALTDGTQPLKFAKKIEKHHHCVADQSSSRGRRRYPPQRGGGGGWRRGNVIHPEAMLDC